jgi:hypothetical protein
MKRPFGLVSFAVMFASAPAASAQDIAAYLQAGLSGPGLGLSFGMGGPVRIRADLHNSNSRNLDGVHAGVPYGGKAKLADSGLYADFYPAGGNFRMVAGLTFNQSRIDLQANASTGSSAQINGRNYSLNGTDSLNAQVRYPPVMPYLGLGWGMGGVEKGFSLIGDLGVAYGKPSSSLDASASLRAKIAATGANPDNELAANRKQLQDDVAKYSFYPILRVGVAYKF